MSPNSNILYRFRAKKKRVSNSRKSQLFFPIFRVSQYILVSPSHKKGGNATNQTEGKTEQIEWEFHLYHALIWLLKSRGVINKNRGRKNWCWKIKKWNVGWYRQFDTRNECMGKIWTVFQLSFEIHTVCAYREKGKLTKGRQSASFHSNNVSRVNHTFYYFIIWIDSISIFSV